MKGLKKTAEGVEVTFRATPRASITELVLQDDGSLRLRVAAPPVDGAANVEIIAFFAKACSLPKRAVSLVAGQRGKQKTVSLAGTSLAAATSCLQEVLR